MVAIFCGHRRGLLEQGSRPGNEAQSRGRRRSAALVVRDAVGAGAGLAQVTVGGTDVEERRVGRGSRGNQARAQPTGAERGGEKQAGPHSQSSGLRRPRCDIITVSGPPTAECWIRDRRDRVEHGKGALERAMGLRGEERE